jgi:hypothetical protein
MDCHLSRLLLAFRRSELTAEDAVALESHLAVCPACADVARRESLEHSVIAAAVNAVPEPTGLRDRLVSAIATQQSAIRWRKAGRWMGGAVVAALLATIGLGVYSWSRPSFATDSFAAQLERERDGSNQVVADWLRAQGLPRTFPYEWDFRYHVIHGSQPFEGTDVPFVLFQNGSESCRVYIVRTGQFRFRENALQDYIGSQFTVLTRKQGNVIYVIAFTGDSLTPFLKRAVLPS